MHEPTGKFCYEDEGGFFLVDESDAFITFGIKILNEEEVSIVSEKLKSLSGKELENEIEFLLDYITPNAHQCHKSYTLMLREYKNELMKFYIKK